MGKILLEEIKAEIEKLEPDLKGKEDDLDYRTAVVLLAALAVGPSVDRLVEFTGYSRDFIAGISLRMHASGLWEGRGVHVSHWFQGDLFSSAPFWADVLVAQGLVEARRAANGELQYRMNVV